MTDRSRLKPKEDEALLIRAKSVEAIDLKHLSRVWDYLRVESTSRGVVLFVRKIEKSKKDICAIGGSHHPCCRANEFLAFRPFQEGVFKTFSFLFSAVRRRQPGKKDIERWWDGLKPYGIRAIVDPESGPQKNLLIFLDKKWLKLMNIR